MTSIVIIEDHALFREGLKCLLREYAGVEVTGEAPDGEKGIKLVEKLKPAVVLLDLVLPGLDGLEVLRRLRKLTKVLAVSMRRDEGFVVDALRTGAAGYVVKEDSFSDLLQGLDAVVQGRRFISGSLDVGRISKLAGGAALESADPLFVLTKREREVLCLAAEGLTSSQMGARLSVSPRTIEMHRNNLMHKLGLSSVAELVRFAVRHRIIPA